MLVARVRAFLSFSHDDNKYFCALVEWFEPDGDSPDAATGLWRVKPEIQDGVQSTAIVNVDCIARAVHLIGVYRDTYIPSDFQFYHTLDAFETFYINRYADYHTHETLI
jgi:hypothetical protein